MHLRLLGTKHSPHTFWHSGGFHRLLGQPVLFWEFTTNPVRKNQVFNFSHKFASSSLINHGPDIVFFTIKTKERLFKGEEALRFYWPSICPKYSTNHSHDQCFLRFALRNHKAIWKSSQFLNLLSALYLRHILRDRWTIVRDHFSVSKRLKKPWS